MTTKFLNPKNDLAFKRIFGTEKNKDILIHFLNDIFARTTNPIEDVTFLKCNHDPVVAVKRSSIVDILCKDSEGRQIIVEMQVASNPGFEKRAQYYAARTYIEQRDRGVNYPDLREVTFLAIVDYVLFPYEKKYLTHHHLLETESHERHLKDFSFSFLELPKFKKRKGELRSMTEKWAYFFKHAPETTEKDLDLIIGSDLVIRRAYDELSNFAWTDEELHNYMRVDMKKSDDEARLKKSREEGRMEGLEEGRTEGRLEGEKGKAIDFAKKLLLKQYPEEEIAELTGLALEHIERLKLIEEETIPSY